MPTNVVGAPVTVTNLQVEVKLVGTFEAPEDVNILTEVSGEVLEMPVREGARVEKGDLLVRLDDARITARLKEARSRLSLAEATFKRTRTLRESQSISEQEFDEAQAAVDQAEASIEVLEEELEDTRIHAPMAGTAGERMVSPGQVVQVGEELMRLVQTDPLEIRFEVPERSLSAVEPGLKVEVTTDAYPGETFEGEVVYLAPELRRTTRTLPVKAEVSNGDGRLKPGMFGNVGLVVREIKDAMFVPESAVQQRGTSTMVMVRDAYGRAEMRTVTVGERQGGRMQIVEGLTPDDVVVAEGLIKTQPGQMLQFTGDSENYGLKPETLPTPVPTPTPSPSAEEGEDTTPEAEA